MMFDTETVDVIHYLFSILLVIIFALIEKNGKVSAFCQKVEALEWGTEKPKLETCLFNNSMDSPYMRLPGSLNGSIEAFSMQNSSNSFYLPMEIHKAFPKLIVYVVKFCPIKEISRNNFRNLHELVKVVLYGNLIEKIGSGTFRDSKKLKTLSLGKRFS